MAIVLRSDFENVKAQLEDTQESLAAAFARIEVFRQREKLLLAEVSKLRTAQATAAAAAAAAGDAEQQQADGTPSTAAAAAGSSTPATTPPPGDAQPPPAQPQQQQQQQADAYEGPELPCYVTEVEGHLPVMLVSGSNGRKTPGSIVITPDYVDFVDVRARIKRHAFIGITAAAAPGRERGHSSGKQGALKSLKHLLPSCMSPGQQQPPSPTATHQRYPAKHPGGPHLVSPSPEPSAASSTSTGGAWMAGAAAAAADLQPEAAAAVSSSSMSWQQLHYQDLSPPSPATAAIGGVGNPQSGSAAAGRRASSGAAGPASPLPVRSPRQSSHTPPPEAVLSSTPETPSGWASGSHSLRHWPTWHEGHTSGGAPGPAAETELSTTAAAAGAAASTSSGGGGGGGGGSPRGSSGSSGGWLEGEGGREGRGVWKILWRGGGMQQQLSFEATHTTREVLHRHTLRWLGEADIETDEISQLAAAAAAGGSSRRRWRGAHGGPAAHDAWSLHTETE